MKKYQKLLKKQYVVIVMQNILSRVFANTKNGARKLLGGFIACIIESLERFIIF